ncbi:aldo/keto reductase [Streptomyces canus]|uniref:aldo/keto reductase n=1 Tax=Streptomyces canus TaxID=58343 RepID=UPI0033F0DD0F
MSTAFAAPWRSLTLLDALPLERTRAVGWVVMKYTQLGRTGLKVSRLALGTMNFGPQTNEADSHAIMDAARDTGINFFDTANVYGWGAEGPYRGDHRQLVRQGRRPARQGRPRHQGVRQHGRRRSSRGPTTASSRRSNIRRAVDASLRRLQTDHIDVHQFHRVDRRTPFEEIWQAIDALITQSKILYGRSSNFPGYKIAQADEIAARRDGTIGPSASSALTSSPSAPPTSTFSRRPSRFGSVGHEPDTDTHAVGEGSPGWVSGGRRRPCRPPRGSWLRGTRSACR